MVKVFVTTAKLREDLKQQVLQLQGVPKKNTPKLNA